MGITAGFRDGCARTVGAPDRRAYYGCRRPLESSFCYFRITLIPSYGGNFQSDTQLKKRVKDIIYVRAVECKLCKLTETVQKN